MKCQKCNQKDAVLNFIQIINNKKTELHLCKRCAQEKGLDNLFSGLSNSLIGLEKDIMNDGKHSSSISKTCPTCGMKFKDFQKTGFLGCSDCYNVFYSEIEDIVLKVHGASKHTGKFPGEKRRVDILKLRRDLDTAIKNEEYERAAAIRDMIKNIENET
jgi:protein arginine kinase activator